MGSVQFDQAMARQAAQRLDSLADLLDRNFHDHSHALALMPAGVDAVSERAVQTFNHVAASYHHSYTQGARELRKLAANLRSHAQQFDKADHAGTEPFVALV
jgi:hypothetical protein